MERPAPFAGLEFAIENQIRIMASMISIGLLIIKNPPNLPGLFNKLPSQKIPPPNLDVAKEAVAIANAIHEEVSKYQWSKQTQRQPQQWPISNSQPTTR